MRIGQLIKRAAKSLKAPSRELSHGYRNATEVTEARIAQIVAQSPSDRSKVAIKDTLCPADHRTHAFQTVGLALSNPLRGKRFAIEFCCTPVPFRLVPTKFVNALTVPMYVV